MNSCIVEWKRIAVAGGALLFLVILVQVTGASAAVVTAGEEVEPPVEYVAGELVVSFSETSDQARISSSLNSIDADDAESVPGLEKTRVIEIDEDQDVFAAADELEDQPGVRWAEPNYIVRAASLPDDPRFGRLWGLRNTGQNSQLVDRLAKPFFGRKGVDIGAPAAWKKTTGSRRNIAVIDSGIDASHPDLGPNINRRLSRNFVSTPEPTKLFGSEVDPGAWDDQTGHGTHVAGTIGAVGDNGLGVTGVNWDARLVAVRALNFNRLGTSADVAAAYAYVGRKGIPIANVSLVGSVGARVEKEAIAASPNTLFVVAAGNVSQNNDRRPSYPCNFNLPNIICVAAIDSRAGLPVFSNYGSKRVDVGAPGVDIESTATNLSAPLDIDFEEGIEAFDQQPYPWKLTEANGFPRLTFDGTDGDVPTPVPGASATLKDSVDLSNQRHCRLNLGNLGYGTDLDLHGAQVFGFSWRADGGPPVDVRLLDAKALDFLRDTGQYEGFPLQFPLVGADGTSDLELRLGFSAGGSQTPLPLIEIGQMKVECVAPMRKVGVYEALSGTSMAAPHVAGVAGLVKSVAPRAGPEKLKKIIMGSVVPTRSLKGRTVTGGRVDAGRAVRFIRPASSPRLAGFTITPEKLTLRPDREASVKVTLRNGGGVAARGLRICLKGPALRVAGTGCSRLGELASGKRRQFRVRVRARPGAGRGSVKLRIEARARGARPASGRLRLKIR